MPDHKFHISQTVFIIPSHARNVPGGAYIIRKNCLSGGGEFEYRIKSVNEPSSVSCAKVNCESSGIRTTVTENDGRKRLPAIRNAMPSGGACDY